VQLLPLETPLADGWVAAISASGAFNFQAQRGTLSSVFGVPAPVGFATFMAVRALTSYTPRATEYLTLRQRVPLGAIADLQWGTSAAAPVTLSFWALCSEAGTFAGGMRSPGPANWDIASLVFKYTLLLGNVWQRVVVTVPGDTRISNKWSLSGDATATGLVLDFSLMEGGTYGFEAINVNAWWALTFFSVHGAKNFASTAGNTFAIAGVQLEKSSVATSFDVRPFDWQPQLQQDWRIAGPSHLKNRLHNGDFAIDQRDISRTATGSPVFPTGTNPVVDRWYLHSPFNYNAVISKRNQDAASISAPPGLTSWLGFECVGAQVNSGIWMYVFQQVELRDSKDLLWGTSDAVPVTLSFWVRANSGALGTYGGAVRSKNQIPARVTRVFVWSYTIATANVWQQVVVSIPGDVGGTTVDWSGTTPLNAQINPFVLEVLFALSNSPNVVPTGQATAGQMNMWLQSKSLLSSDQQMNFAATVGNKIYFSGMQLERGVRRTEFDARSAADEMTLCSRYLRMLPTNSVLTGRVDNSTDLRFSTRWPIPMRTTPKMSAPLTLPTVVADLVDQPTSGRTLSSSSSTPYGTDMVVRAASSHGVDLAVAVQLRVNAPIAFSADVV
jgi:hypothetical protein